MARLGLKQRRDKRILMRYKEKAFSMNDEEFEARYMVERDLFDYVYENLRPFLPVPKRISEITPNYKVLVTLSFFATGSYQKLVGDTYGAAMAQQSVSRAIREVTEALNLPEVQSKWIKFPQTTEERDAVKNRFYEKFQLPSVIGCIDGTQVAIIRPKENEERYLNKKCSHSLNVMIISDADLNILAVDASFGGASRDRDVWNHHPINDNLKQLINNGENVVLLGDSEYAQREYMMTPILDATEGTPEDHYNTLHCMARKTVERTISILKNKWQCLLGRKLLYYHPDVAAKFIIACCVLHNMCINRGGTEEYEAETLQDNPTCTYPEPANTIAELRLGIERRNVFVQQLWAIREQNELCVFIS